MGPRGRRLAIAGIGVALGLPFVLFVVLALILRHAPPTEVTRDGADALARRIEAAVGVDAWAKVGAVRWRSFARQHLWDRQRGLARVRWRKNEVLLDVGRRSGRASVDGRPVDDAALVEHAYKLFINDSFWLNPLAKLFDEGVERLVATVDGRPALLLRYASGGVTPGDRYLWMLDDGGRPYAWRVWAKILPVGGVEFSWEGWTALPGGAQVASEHRVLGRMVVHLTEIAGAPSLSELEPGPDPFAPLR
jgi:hypothetical protein